MNESWQKRLLLAAAAWNVVGGVTALIDPAKHFAQLYTLSLSLDQPLQLFFYRCTWINVIAWGVAYFLAAVTPSSRTAALAAGAGGKFAYFLACVALFSSHVGKTFLLATGMVDLLFTALFIVVLMSQRQVR